jgi:uncharacterized protein YndB with AHSA1/START domain
VDRTGSSEPAAARPVSVERISEREVVVRRTFDAPARLVFEAWTTPDLFRQWWLPQSMGARLRSLDMDARTGGSYRLDFGDGMAFYGTYKEVTPPTRIVWTNEEGGESGSVTTVVLQEQDGVTHLVLTEVFPSREALEQGDGALDALHETFAQLDDLLVQLLA